MAKRGPAADPSAATVNNDLFEPADSGIDPGIEGTADSAPAPTLPRARSLIDYPAAPPDESAEDPSSDSPGENFRDAVIARKLDAVPAEPGVYLLRDGAGKVLYVGKAKSLRSRVRAYFRDSGDTRFQVRFLISRVRDFDTLVARSEKEALI